MLNCAFNLPYFSFLNYSARGSTSASENSRNLCAGVKAGRTEVINAIVQALANHDKEALKPFLSKEVSLVPIPRSALLREGDMWPALEICKVLIKLGFAKDILPFLKRSQPIRKSSSQFSAESRPSVIDHYNSITLERELGVPENVTLIDDVLTLGRTAYACACKIQETFPQVKPSLFSVFRTRGFENTEITSVYDHTTGYISFNPASGKTTRHPD
jgi:hypothetical protein